MNNSDLKNTVEAILQSLISDPVISSGKYCILEGTAKSIPGGISERMTEAMAEAMATGKTDVILCLKYRNHPVDSKDDEMAHSYWVIYCSDTGVVSVDFLKEFKDFWAGLAGRKVKATVLTSKYPFAREAINFAVQNNIGIARVAPHTGCKNDCGFCPLILGPAHIELKTALCENDFGARRLNFYGFSANGKAEQLGSLKHYLQNELKAI